MTPRRENLPVEERILLLEIMQDEAAKTNEKIAQALENLALAFSKTAFNDLPHIQNSLAEIRVDLGEQKVNTQLLMEHFEAHLQDCQETKQKPMNMQNWILVIGGLAITILLGVLAIRGV